MPGQLELIELIDDELLKLNKLEENTEKSAKSFVEDLNRLSSPYSQIRKSGYTHLVRSFSYKKNKNEFEVGWGKYYGPFLEKGTKNTKAIPHLEPLFKKNEEKYLKIMKGE